MYRLFALLLSLALLTGCAQGTQDVKKKSIGTEVKNSVESSEDSVGKETDLRDNKIPIEVPDVPDDEPYFATDNGPRNQPLLVDAVNSGKALEFCGQWFGITGTKLIEVMEASLTDTAWEVQMIDPDWERAVLTDPILGSISVYNTSDKDLPSDECIVSMYGFTAEQQMSTIDGIEIGMSTAALKDLLGEPTKSTVNEQFGAVTYYYEQDIKPVEKATGTQFVFYFYDNVLTSVQIGWLWF